ncbi:hypothetical protein BU17DRAFT_63599 [Hysterangium stoloniferum]|nr:hypothetical protein BU17DRAFT_63599 [Hysterangium stoloniferum]
MSYNTSQLASYVQAESDNSSQLSFYWIIAGSVIAFYDTILTFPQEVRFIWTEKFRGMTLLYMTARLSMLLYQALYATWALAGFWAKTITLLENCDPTFPTLTAINIADGLALLYDTAVFGVTVYYTWTLVKLRWSLMTSDTSLGCLILKQDDHNQQPLQLKLIRLLRTLISRRFTFVSSVSTLLVLRFFLDLREQNAHPNGTSQTGELAPPYSSFKAAVRKFSNGIIEDLGDPEDEALFASQAMSSRKVFGQVLRPSATEAENNDSSTAVNLEEFPGTAGRLDHPEAGIGNNTV